MSEASNSPNPTSESDAKVEESEQSFNMSDTSVANKSADLHSDSSKLDIDTSSSSIVIEKETIGPKAKKIRLSKTESKLKNAELEKLRIEREKLRKEKEELKAKIERDKVAKQKETLEAMKLKLEETKKKEEEKNAEREKKQQEKQKKQEELLKKKQEQEEKKKIKDEDRERKEREKKEKREAQEKEKLRKQEEKKATENIKKQQEELNEKNLQKSREILGNFLLKSKPNAENNANTSFTTESGTNGWSITPANLIDSFDALSFEKALDNQSLPIESLYLRQLLSGHLKPYIALQNTNDEPEIIEESAEGGQNDKFVFMQFHENIRPAYFGKRLHDLTLSTLNGRNPYRKQEFLDYEIESDEEWDMGGPGESLSGSESENDEKDDYEIDQKFMVPHGYLSDEENIFGDEGESIDSSIKPSSGPLMKEQTLMAERNQRFAKHLTPHIIGCIWQADQESLREKFDFLQQFKAVRIAP